MPRMPQQYGSRNMHKTQISARMSSHHEFLAIFQPTAVISGVQNDERASRLLLENKEENSCRGYALIILSSLEVDTLVHTSTLKTLGTPF